MRTLALPDNAFPSVACLAVSVRLTGTLVDKALSQVFRAVTRPDEGKRRNAENVPSSNRDTDVARGHQRTRRQT